MLLTKTQNYFIFRLFSKMIKNTRDKNQQSCDVALKKLVTPGEVCRFYVVNPIGVPLKISRYFLLYNATV
jgi:hypothetical protein